MIEVELIYTFITGQFVDSKEKGIGTVIHYPIPPHKQACYSSWNHLSFPVTEKIHKEELSIPLNPTLTKEEIKYIVDCINNFQG